MDAPVGSLRLRRSDFLQMLHRLGAGSELNRRQLDSETWEMEGIQHVYLHCRYDQWLQAFGEPDMVSSGFASAIGTTVHAWRHRCVDGPVMCIGHLPEPPSEVGWVIVFRICFI
jgi:hypothetical protein